MERKEVILNYWFGEVTDDPAALESRARLWFGKDEETDRYIGEHFEGDVSKAADGEYDIRAVDGHAL